MTLMPRKGRARSGAWATAALAVVALALATAGSTPSAQGQPDRNWRVIDDDSCNHIGQACQVREITLPAWKDVRVRTTNGSITVNAWDRNEIHIRARVTASGSKKAARETFDQIVIKADEDGIRADGPHRGWGLFHLGGGWSVSYEIDAPAASMLTANTVNGGIHIHGIAGDVAFGTTNGRVDVTGAGGAVTGETTNGGINLALDPKTWHGGGIDLETTNGGVGVETPADFSAEVDVSTTNGSISVDHPITIERKSRGHLRGRIGSGEASVHISTTNGGVALRRADV